MINTSEHKFHVWICCSIDQDLFAFRGDGIIDYRLQIPGFGLFHRNSLEANGVLQMELSAALQSGFTDSAIVQHTVSTATHKRTVQSYLSVFQIANDRKS